MATPRSRAPLVLAALGLAACEAGASELPVVWEGEHVDFATELDVEGLCAGTLPQLDAATGHLAALLGDADQRVRFHWVGDAIADYCTPGDVIGCTRPNRAHAFSQLPIHYHELVHAVRPDQHMYAPLEEGLAEAFGDDFWYGDPLTTSTAQLVELLDEGADSEGIVADRYARLGHFVAALRHEFGVEALREFDRRTGLNEAPDAAGQAFTAVFDRSFAEAASSYADAFPTVLASSQCDRTHYRDDGLECADVVGTVGPAQAFELTRPMGCTDARVIGPRMGLRWTTVALAIEQTGVYELALWGASPDGTPVPSGYRVRHCGAGCVGPAAQGLDGLMPADLTACLYQGTTVFRLMVEDTAPDDVELVMHLRRVADGPCP